MTKNPGEPAKVNHYPDDDKNDRLAHDIQHLLNELDERKTNHSKMNWRILSVPNLPL